MRFQFGTVLNTGSSWIAVTVLDCTVILATKVDVIIRESG
jgi:hypothetical protein